MTYGWSRAALLAAALAAPGGDPTPPPGSVLRLEAPLPAGWREAAHVVLILEDVVTPRGAAFKVRARAAASDHRAEPLGSFGVLAEQPGALGQRPPATYRVDVTRGLRRWAQRHPDAQAVGLELAAQGPDGKPAAVDWRVDRVRFELRPR
jgi:hypothetical protein